MLKTQIFILLLSASGAFAHAAKFVSQPNAGEVTFEAVGKPAMLKVRGHGPAASGEFVIGGGKVSGTSEFELARLETGMDLRDRHMKEKYLEVEKHPKAKLTLTDLAVPAGFGAASSLGETRFVGTLLLHGVEKPVEGTLSYASGKAEARFEAKLSDFGIAVPSYMGITIADTVKVFVAMGLKESQ